MKKIEDVLHGLLKIYQPEIGPRVNVDTILLAGFTSVKRKGRILELGCAHGVLSLIMAYRHRESHITALDIQPELCRLATENCRLNNLDQNVDVIQGDLRNYRSLFQPQSFDVVVANPPYGEIGRGRLSPNLTDRLARQGEECTLADICEATHFTLRNKGRLFMVMRSIRLAELIELLRQHHVEPKTLQMVHGRADLPASVFLLEAVRAGGPGLKILPPLILHNPDGTDTEQLKLFYGKEDPSCR